MPKMIQLRNVSDALHRKLKDRAAQAGMSLSDFLIAEVERTAARPTIEELEARIRSRGSTELSVRPHVLIREMREHR